MSNRHTCMHTGTQAQWLEHIHFFLRTERGKRHKAPPWEFVKTFQQSESGQRIGNSRGGLTLSLSPSPFGVHKAALQYSKVSCKRAFTPLCGACSKDDWAQEGYQNNLQKAGQTKDESSPLDLATMKPLLVFLVSTAWAFTRGQYYYQELMNYLENRMLAIEVRGKLPVNHWESIKLISMHENCCTSWSWH